jgi:phosphoribosylaminoimidazole carboxylase (NCAIR synthetase)
MTLNRDNFSPITKAALLSEKSKKGKKKESRSHLKGKDETQNGRRVSHIQVIRSIG